MEWKAGIKLHGFKLVRDTDVKEVNSQALLFEHIKTGARLLYLSNDDDNKVFSVAFRTPPSDNTGVAHILEHSVLCGSRKFTSKEPFVELVKGSMNTFLNAMTYPDKTVYPVASRNHQDFRNLLDVYLDAVFFPIIYDRPEIFRQEGWHYEIDSPENELMINGVVYSEMKGVFSTPGNFLARKIQQSLFPDNMYGFESGGIPDFIPDLTPEKFLQFHRQYYHPSNAWIYLYGDLDIKATLEFIDSEYLGKFDRRKEVVKLPRQAAFEQKHNLTADYTLAANEKSDGKTILSLNWVIGDAADAETAFVFDLLKDILVENEAGIIKRALLNQGVGQEITASFDTALQQPIFSIVAWDARTNQQAEFEQIVCDSLAKLVEQGINNKLLQSVFNYHEFKLREADFRQYPKGLIYNLRCLDSWLYDVDPLLNLQYEPILLKVKREIENNTDYFAELITEHLLENNHSAAVVVRPKPGLEEKRTAERKRKLSDIKSRLKDEELQTLISENVALKRFQEKADTLEDLATIPTLALSDINKQSEMIISREMTVEGIKMLFQPMFTNRIAYVNFYFDTSVVPQTLLPYLFLLTDLLGRVDTEKHSYADLDIAINRHTGGIHYDSVAISDLRNGGNYHPRFIVKSRSLINHLPQLCELVAEILMSSKFADPSRIKEIIRELRTNMRENMFTNGRQIVMSRLLSYMSAAGQYNEYGEYSYYRFLCKLDNDYRDMATDVAINLQRVAAMVFDRNRLMVGLTCAERDLEYLRQSIVPLVSRLNNEILPQQTFNFVTAAANEGFMLAAKVQHVMKGYDFTKFNYSYNGNMKVLETILQFDYLWNKIRVLGGAYGPIVRIAVSGEVILGSYRDPNLAESLRVFDKTGDYLRNFAADGREMERYIIGTISRLDMPLTPSMKGEKSATMFIQNRRHEDIQCEREQVLATTVEGIRQWADMFDAVMQANHMCVMGNEELLQNERSLFGNLIKVAD